MAAVKVTDSSHSPTHWPQLAVFACKSHNIFLFVFRTVFTFRAFGRVAKSHESVHLASAKYSDEWAHMWSKLWLHAQINSRLPTTDIPAEGRKQLIGQICHFLTREKMAPG